MTADQVTALLPIISQLREMGASDIEIGSFRVVFQPEMRKQAPLAEPAKYSFEEQLLLREQVEAAKKIINDTGTYNESDLFYSADGSGS